MVRLSAKVTGFDELQKQLGQVQKALASLDGKIAEVKFDPDKPESVGAAVKEIESAMDARVRPYATNATVAALVKDLKKKYGRQIEDRAAALRAKAKV